MKTKLDAWRSYEHIHKHYVLEGDQLHWLAVSLYVSCRKYKHLTTNQKTIRDINRQYDEIVLTNSIIDERIFLENKFQLNDLCNSLNEYRYSKSSQNLTPLTANQHITSNDYQTISFNQYLTSIYQANLLIKLLYSIVQQQQTFLD
ncbi:unnamed protein product [Rotaria sp. Silwood1]|nr:unnamed protein product [Rotaria sp. Silwood1]